MRSQSDAASLSAVQDRLQAANVAITHADDATVLVRDPAGNQLRIVAV